MPITTTLEPQGVYQRYTGLIGAGELRESRKRSAGAPHLGAPYYILDDFTAAAFGPDVDLSTLTELANLDEAFRVRHERVYWIAVASDPEQLAVIRTYAYLAPRPLPLMIFPTLEQARAWIRKLLS